MANYQRTRGRFTHLKVSEILEMDGDYAESLAAELLSEGEKPLRLTQSLCPGCVDDGVYGEMSVPALVLERDGEVWMRKECGEHGTYEDVYWSDYEMYAEASEHGDEGVELLNPHVEGDVNCPMSCGLCTEHRSHTALGNIVVTNRCDLRCFYCFFYAEEGEPVYEPSLGEIRGMLKDLRSIEPVGANCLQITGGEPSLREDITDIVAMAKEEGFDHVQFNTDGIRFSGDVDFIRSLREAGVNIAYLSFDGLTPETNPKNYYEMPEILENLREARLGTVLVPTVIGGKNDSELGDIVRLASDNMDVVRGVNFQPVSIVGRMPRSRRMEQRVTIPDVCELLEEQTDGRLRKEDFYPIPVVTNITEFLEGLRDTAGEDGSTYRLSNHFACGVGTYVFESRDGLVPITRFIDVEGFFEALGNLGEEMRSSRFKKIRRTTALAKLLLKLRRLVDEEKQPEGVDVVSAIYDALRKGDYQGLKKFHHQSLFVGMMHFMDPYNYDVDRVQRCDIHYAVPGGGVVPFCAFNVLPDLYRDRIQERHSIPAAEWEQRTGRSLVEDKYTRVFDEDEKKNAEDFYEGYRRKPYRDK